MKGHNPTRRMRIIGLTGGIGMGKSTAAGILRGFGLPVFNADKAVHALLRKGGKGVKPVARLFPEARRKDAIDRKKLAHIVFNHALRLKQLEKILHPLVRQAEQQFLRVARARKAQAVVLEIPLLFETGGERRCDATILVTAPKTVQRKRVMQRQDMTKEKLAAIHKRQMPDVEKRRRADYIVSTGGTRAQTRKSLRHAVDRILKD